MEVDTRFAVRGDLEALAGLAADAVDEQVDARGGWVWSRREVRPRPFVMSLEAALSDPDQQLWIGTIDGAPVGYATAVVEVLQTGELLGRVLDLYVTPGAREVAVGEALIEQVLRWCDEHQCIGVDALALPGNRATKNFFETFGFTARLLVLHRKLRPQPSPDAGE